MSNKDLIIKEISNSPLVKKEYKQMLTNINSSLPAIKKSSSNFYKSHSQFMGVMLDVTAITPIRSVKHTLAELDKTRMALEEAQLKMMKKDTELRKKEKDLEDGKYDDQFERETLEIEILEIKVNMSNIQNSISGFTSGLVHKFETFYVGFDDNTSPTNLGNLLGLRKYPAFVK